MSPYRKPSQINVDRLPLLWNGTGRSTTLHIPING